MNKIMILAVVALLVGCGVEKDEPQQVPEKTTKVGPFDLQVSTSDRKLTNEFSVDIAQNEGRVDFNFKPDERVQLQFEGATTTVTGCDASKVSVIHYWAEDSAKNKSSVVVRQSSKFYAAPKVLNTFSVGFLNLEGCKKLSYRLNVRKIEWPKRPSTWDTDIDPRLLGNWEFQKNGNRIQLFVRSLPEVGWLEDNGVRYTCDRTLRIPKTSSEVTPNRLIDDGQGLDCIYKLSADNLTMRVNCQANGWSCTVPDEYEFVKR